MEGRRSICLLNFAAIPLLVLLMSFLFPSLSSANNVNCDNQALQDDTLEALVDCIESHMPKKKEEGVPGGYRPPNASERYDWREIVGDMLDGEPACSYISLGSLDSIYDIFYFVDVENGKSYCVAMEVSDIYDKYGNPSSDGIVDRGLGTIIVNQSPTRELIIQSPHAKAETNTHAQGAYVFKDTDARVFLMSGTHRYANSEESSCEAGYVISDMAHNKDNFFQEATIEIDSFYAGIGKDFTTVQFHGMGSGSCVGTDVFISYGTIPDNPIDHGEIIYILKDNLITDLCPFIPEGYTCNIEVAGDGSCNLYATENVQGRYLNDVYENEVCDNNADHYTKKFIHIEQKSHVRGYDVPTPWPWKEKWAVSFNDTFDAFPIYALAVDNKTGSGSGTVSSWPAGINCGDDCSGTYNEGTHVTLTATSDATSVFTGWSGGGCSGTDPCVVTMTAATTVTANFELKPIRIGSTYYTSLQEAYNAASPNDVIQSQDTLFIENVTTGSPDKYVIFQGGYNLDYTSIIGITTMKGQFHSNDFGVVKLRNFRVSLP